MNPSLYPYQTRLLDDLMRETSAPRRVQIVAPTGVGIGTVLVNLATSLFDAGGDILVLTSRSVLADEWEARLFAAGVTRVHHLRAASDAVLAMDDLSSLEDVVPSVTIATLEVLSHGAGRRAADQLRPALLIVDGGYSLAAPFGAQSEALSALLARSLRVVVQSNSATVLHWLSDAEVITVPLRAAVGGRVHQTVAFARYQSSAEEAQVFVDSARVLAAISAEFVRASTRPALHGTLLRLASGISVTGQSQLPDSFVNQPTIALAASSESIVEVWSLIDRIEALGDDPRLAKLAELVEGFVGSDGPVIVVTDRVDELEYVASHLDASAPVRRLSGSTRPAERREAIDPAGGGQVVVATTASLKGLEYPGSWTQIWWSGPNNLPDAAVRLSRAVGRSMTIALVSDPAGEADSRMMEVVEQVRNELGADTIVVRAL